MNLIKKINEKKFSLLKKENIYSILLITLIFTLDRLSKAEIINDINSKSIYVNKFINFDLVWNTGVGFGLFSSESFLIYNLISILIGIVILTLFGVCLMSKSFDKFIFSVIIGGAIGNFYDMLFYNAVPDFIDIHYNNFHWFTFNVADIFITLGIITFVFKGFFEKK